MTAKEKLHLKFGSETGFGAFGLGGPSGLVFGKSGISLPVPSPPSPAASHLVLAGDSTPSEASDSRACCWRLLKSRQAFANLEGETDLRVRAVQKRPLTGAVAREIDESDSSDSEPPREDFQDDVWLPTPAASGAGSGDGESSEAFSVSDVTDLTSSTSEGGPPTRVVALPLNTVEFASWEAFDEYLAAYEAQTFQGAL
ncbi:hypothetical protein PInf_019027 [Phytophthora infestans]|nr:hypothetical protein PInf_019027 [Phytophthora infestans]